MNRHFDFVVIGSGPGGQKAAIRAAKCGKRVALVEQDRRLGGACVHHGTIPSKALREVAYRTIRKRREDSDVAAGPLELELATLLTEVDQIVSSYSSTIRDQMERNGVEIVHGRGRFVGPNEIGIRRRNGEDEVLNTGHVIIATGSRPRHPDGITVDHEHVLDADSILKLAYLPRTMVVLGAGVIACEYASIFSSLGVDVTIIDRGDRPLAFVDEDLTAAFLNAFEAVGGRYLARRSVEEVRFDGVSTVEVELGDGNVVRGEKVFVALGRSGCLESLDLAAAGLAATQRGTLEVDSSGATAVPHVYGVGDVAGPPALATSAMEQGRRAVLAALDLPFGSFGQFIPTGIYAIPEIASVGATETEAKEATPAAVVGRSRFQELARGQISDVGPGLLKIVADPMSRRILGVHCIGEGSADLVHVGQMAMIAGATVDDLIENVFNFPTLTESYRTAALDCANRIEDVKVDRVPV